MVCNYKFVQRAIFQSKGGPAEHTILVYRTNDLFYFILLYEKGLEHSKILVKYINHWIHGKCSDVGRFRLWAAAFKWNVHTGAVELNKWSWLLQVPQSWCQRCWWCLSTFSSCRLAFVSEQTHITTRFTLSLKPGTKDNRWKSLVLKLSLQYFPSCYLLLN